MPTMDTTATHRHSMRAISATTGGAKMPQCKAVLWLSVMLLVPVMVWPQARESGRLQAQAVDGQGQAARTGGSSADSFSTGITGVRVVLGAGDLLEISVFDTPELTHRTRV